MMRKKEVGNQKDADQILLDSFSEARLRSGLNGTTAWICTSKAHRSFIRGIHV
jgi:hypothetical protein